MDDSSKVGRHARAVLAAAKAFHTEAAGVRAEPDRLLALAAAKFQAVRDSLVAEQLRAMPVDKLRDTKANLRLSTLKATGAAAERVKLPEGVLSPAEAAKKVGEKVTVQYVVASVGGQTNMYLNSEKDYRSKDNFAVVLSPKARMGKWEKATAATFTGKTVRATGTVRLNREAPQLEIADEKDVEIVEK